MIIFENVCKSFGGKSVLNGFSFSVGEGERICLMGASGCGKSTVINILLGIIPPDSGTVWCPPCAAVFQEDRLCENFSAISNVRMVMKGKNTARARELLERLLPEEDISKPVREYSGGMKRRTAIARALAYDSPILLLDEPFKGLDSETRAATAELISRETKNRTLLFVSHDRKEAELLGARIIEM